MRIKREVFSVASGVRSEMGEKAEPEQQPTRLVLETSMPVALSNGATPPKDMRTLVTHDAPAGEMAAELAAKCARCKHFKRQAWQALVAECDFPTAPLMKRQAINEVRTALLTTRNAQITVAGADEDGDFDVENVLRTHLGLCSQLSDIKKDYVVVHQFGCCPQAQLDATGKVVAIKTKERPMGLFTPRDSEARKEAQAMRDNVLLAASGKAPTP